ncbi:MAG: hypothetical protein PHC53_01160 [Patescibacteria group bacterium]|nr:hypothetical protein [Patescibacteria group bacterium]
MSAISERHNSLTKIDDHGSTSSSDSKQQIGRHAASARVLDEHFPGAQRVGLEVRHSSDAPLAPED